MPPESNPRLLFERLFGEGAHGSAERGLPSARQQTQRSMLDFVMSDARALQRKLGDRDDQKLDEYFTSIRDIEKRIEHAESFGDIPDPDIDTPAGVPSEVGDHMDLMYDLLALAFQTDSTRIATMMLGHDGDNRPYPQLGVADGHHNISHHQEKPDLLDKIARIDTHHVEHFARFLRKARQHTRRRRPLAPRQLLDRLRGRQCRSQPPLAHRPAGDPGRLGRRPHRDGPLLEGAIAADVQPVPRHARPVGVEGVPRLGDSTGRKVIV